MKFIGKHVVKSFAEFAQDVEFQAAVNIGSSSLNKAELSYTLDGVHFDIFDIKTFTSSTDTDAGKIRFFVDEVFTAAFLDDGLNIAQSGNLAFGGVDIIDDNSGTTTLKNIDALDATTISTFNSALSDNNTTYGISCVDGDNSDEEKIRLTDSSGSTDDVVLEAGTGLSIARSSDKITFTNTVTDTNTMGSGFTVSATTDTNATTITQGDDLFFAAGTGITCETTADGTVTITNTVSDTNTQLSNEQVQDIVGGMVTGNTESGITVTYQDGDGTLDFTVGTLNQDTSGNAATATALETAREISGVAFDGTGDITLNNSNITNGAGYTTNTGDITGVSITTDSGGGSKAEDTGGSADFSILGSNGVGVTNSGTTITAVAVPSEIDHDSLNNFVANEHIDWTGSSAGTIHSTNIPTLNQDTTGEAGTVATIAGLAPNTATTQATQPNITTLAGLTSLGAAGATTDIAAGDLTMYNAVNNGNPTFSIGSSATNRLVIQPVYNSGAQTIDYVEFNTYTTSSTNHDGRYLFKVDEVEIARLLDTGALFQGLVQTTGDGARVVCKDTDTSSASNGAEIELRTDDGAAMANDHRLGIIKFTGAENASNTITTGAQIEAFCEAAWSASENGARLVFSTTDGNASTSTVLTLDSDKKATFTGPIACTTRTLAVTSSTDGDANGDVVYFGGTTSMTVGKIYHYKSDGTWEIANADAVSTADGLLGVALGSASDTDGVLLRGMVTLDHDPGAIGDVLYVQSDNAGTPGNATATAPSASGDCVRIIGYQVSHASNGNIWFNPDSTFVEVA